MVIEVGKKEKEMLTKVLESFADEMRTVRLKTDKRESRVALKEEESIVRRMLESVQKSEEVVMDVQDYCKNVSLELSAWKAKVADVADKLDRIRTGKEDIASEVEELNTVVKQLGKRVDELNVECSTSWNAEKGALTDIKREEKFGPVSMS